MRIMIKLVISIGMTFALAGCFGESYDFSPPSVSLEGSLSKLKLTEANIDWKYDSDQYNKKTADIHSLLRKDINMYFQSGEQAALELDDGDYDPDAIDISLWKNDEQVEIEYNKTDQIFSLPEKTGKFMIVVDAGSKQGRAQYVGLIEIIQ